MPHLPLAAGDFIGIIVFVIIAILSALKNRNQKSDDIEDFPHTPSSPPPLKPTPAQLDPAEEIRKFMEQVRKVNTPQPASPPALPPKLPQPLQQSRTHVPPAAAEPRQSRTHAPMAQRHPAQSRSHAAARKASQTGYPPSLPAMVPDEEGPQAMIAESLETNIRQEIRQSMIDSHTNIQVASLQEVSAPSSVDSSSPKDEPAKSFSRADMFRSREGARQSMLLLEIFGKPRSVEPYSGPA